MYSDYYVFLDREDPRPNTRVRLVPPRETRFVIPWSEFPSLPQAFLDVDGSALSVLSLPRAALYFSGVVSGASFSETKERFAWAVDAEFALALMRCTMCAMHRLELISISVPQTAKGFNHFGT